MEFSRRFIACYNEVDRILRDLTDTKPQISFTEALRRATGFNAVARRYADDLFAYARLRNAIVHTMDGDDAIAEPHPDVVEKFEHILTLLRRPPLVRDVLGDRTVIRVEAEHPLLDVIRFMERHGYSNLPVTSCGELAGLVTPKDVVRALGVCLESGSSADEWMRTACVGDIPRTARYAILSRDATVPEVTEKFSDDRKLRAVILTKDGGRHTDVSDIVTAGDLPALTAALR